MRFLISSSVILTFLVRVVSDVENKIVCLFSKTARLTELVAFMILKGTKDKDSGIAGDHIIEGALLLAVSQALKSRHDKETNSKEN